MSRHVEVVADGFSYVMSPRWHDGRLWVSDLYTPAVLAIDLDGSVEHVAEVAGQPAGLGWLPDDRLLIVSMRDHRILRREPSGDLVVHADLSPLHLAGHLNGMVVSAYGLAYVGNFGYDLMGGAAMRTTQLHCVTMDGEVATVADGLQLPNGMVMTPDNTLLVAETLGNRITAYDSGTDGALHNPRRWATFEPTPRADGTGAVAGPVAPAGMCADIEGAIWVADALGNRVLRVREDGEVAEEIATGGLGVYGCMLGGHDGRTLYLCAAPSFAERERRDTRDGVLLAAQVDVPHGALP
ncbi:SMP-30/gluconolactonase/LRE family protein [Solicola gregarius]|uniref:SMP-30/gluconolactonase/LRE family protein n=1 Tax=Solicola gregarius TaxID=2908642 RepID=A0AA46TKT9_9ACTN|nr:SMP-30/gluconolactonase/LRE family protein [Solicola gregarius]UYM07147.1 SMP-30/gluconolactonase/LRE family protein [Solicola gregarius]